MVNSRTHAWIFALCGGICGLVLIWAMAGCSKSPSAQNTLEEPAAVVATDAADDSSKDSGADPLADSGDIRRQLSSLTPLENCDAMLAHLRERIMSDMEAELDRQMTSALAGNQCRYYYPYDGTGVTVTTVSTPGVTSTVDTVANETIATGDAASDYSTTNTQVAGVDEADFIKNDGSHIYVLADGMLQIIAAWPPDQAHVVSRTAIQGTPKKLYVAENRALVFSSLPDVAAPSPIAPLFAPVSYRNDDCTYGYDCDFRGDGNKLEMTLLDISEPASPKRLREIVFSGSYINSRRIGTAVHTVIHFQKEPRITGISYWPEGLPQCWTDDDRPDEAGIITAFEALREKNRGLIDDADLSSLLPDIQETRFLDDGSLVHITTPVCDRLYASTLPDGRTFLSIVSLNMDRLQDLKQTTILGRPGAVYATDASLYVASRQYRRPVFPWFFDTGTGAEEATTIHQFALENSPADCDYAGSGVVRGRVLNQFAMDEHDGYFRIATTVGHLPSPDVSSLLSILTPADGALTLVGGIDGIAPGEDIRSVRFDGQRAFVVTFKKTDPLFVFDLAQPEAPRLCGELKIPGFSTYMQLMDPDHLLTIGYDADDQGSMAWFQGILLQIFDVGDMAAPTLVHKELIGTRGTTSEAATNHLAFNYFPPKDVLAIPMTICDESSGGSDYGDVMSFSGLSVYDVTVQGGFAERGRISHVDPGSDQSLYACNNWWTNSNSVVQRSIIMDDFVFSVALDQIKIAHLDDLSQILQTIRLVDTN